jgi:hypothetical protein
MNIVPIVGALSLGIVVGWLVRYFLRRFEKFTPQALGSVITIIVGGAVVKFLEVEKTVWWFYPIGLLVGFILYSIIALWAIGDSKVYIRPNSDEAETGKEPTTAIGKDISQTTTPREGILYEKPSDLMIKRQNYN